MDMSIGIYGATGAVGRELISVLAKRKFPIKELRIFSSKKNAGQVMETPFGNIVLENGEEPDFSGIDLAFFAVGGDWSKKYARKATAEGCVVIDNSSAFRYDEDVPLVVPEINGEQVMGNRLIANPNCTTAIAAIPLWVVRNLFGLKKVMISTYQAASGAGQSGIKELMDQARSFVKGEKIEVHKFPHQLLFNIIPHIDSFQPNLYTREEMKVVWELRKIFGDHSMKVSCTAVRVPTLRAHAENIIVETEREVDTEKFREMLSKEEGVVVTDEPSKNVYPMPITASHLDDVQVGRIRKSLVFGNKGLEFFVCGDQLLRGAALNAVKIAERIYLQ